MDEMIGDFQGGYDFNGNIFKKMLHQAKSKLFSKSDAKPRVESTENVSSRDAKLDYL